MSEPAERQTQMLGEAGEPCGGCGAPLAADQRYCVNCGHRRGGPRVDFRAHLPSGASTPNVAPQRAPETAGEPAAADPTPRRDYTPLAAVGGIAVLGVMLLIGVLIGKGNSPTTTAAPPQIVRLGGESGGGATAANEADGSAAAEPKKAKSKGSKEAAGGKDLLSGEGGGAGPVEASDQALQELQEQSPEDYSKSSAKLPDEIATPGTAPPTDSKAPGGGSKGTAIE